jgi:anti-sigma28 factor (negative regulator of flagellin synthesis)
MTVATLSIVPQTNTKSAESLSARVKRLQTEASEIAREHVMALEEALAGVSQLAAEIADGGEAYPVGARQIARQLIADTDSRAQTLSVILSRSAGR